MTPRIVSDAASWVNNNILWERIIDPSIWLAYLSMRTIGPVVHNHLPQEVRSIARQGILFLSNNIFNQRWILDPLLNVGSALAVASAGAEFGDQVGEDAALFFWFGRNHYGHEFASGEEQELDEEDSSEKKSNCFFPSALASGPVSQEDTNEDAAPMTNDNNLKIAKSCALFSLMCYRSDEDILKSMTSAAASEEHEQEHPRNSPVMFPRTSFFSVHTDQEGDLGIFVDWDQTWAVFCFRGTEPESARDWFTSILLNPTQLFVGGASDDGTDDGRRRMGQLKVRDRYFQQMRHATRNFPVTLVTDPQHSPIPTPPRSATPSVVSAADLALYLSRQGCKIYCTGHSLGGGLATLLGAEMTAWGLNPTAIVSFGSPPVGDANFCNWFNNNVSVSWRFVNRDEFAPMAPPLPFTDGDPADQELRHVGGLIKVEDMGNADPEEPTPQDMARRLEELSKSEEESLNKIILDHNLAVTLRELRQFNPAAATENTTEEEQFNDPGN